MSQNIAAAEGLRLLGRFTVGRCLGSGTFGVVYEAREEGRAGKIALKKLSELDASAIYAFKQEFRALSDVVHPNLVGLYELFSVGEQLYIAMELVDGMSFIDYVRADLRALDLASVPTFEMARSSASISLSTSTSGAWTERSSISFEEIPATTRISEARGAAAAPPPLAPGLDYDWEGLRATLRQLASGVLAIHEAGKLHRDLKPSNVMVTAQRRVKILDFGLVASLPSRAQRHVDRRVVGTPAYMSPEQAAGATLSPASDWYAFGVILYETLTGRLPITGTVTELLVKKQHLDPPDPRVLVPALPADLADLCVALLQRDPSSRPGGAAVLRALGAPVTEALTAVSPWSDALPFVGREHHVHVLEEAFGVTRGGRAVTMHVHGTSGMGKSALLRRFLDGLAERDGAVVLEGRCYERESMPYKAVDSLVDALTQHLRALPLDMARAIVPHDVQSLARLFPVLRRAEVVAKAPRQVEVPDPKELRRRAFGALREMFRRLSSIRPLVVCIDDLQWGDADSAALLMDLLEPPDAPPLLLVLSYRTEDVGTIELVRVARERLARGELVSDVRELVVGPLTRREARALARVLLAGDPALVRGDAEVIAVESGGSPFFVHELARYARASGAALDADPAPPSSTSALPPRPVVPRISLQHVLESRLARLSPRARRLLDVIAVAGRPVAYSAAFRATDDGLEEATPDPHLLMVLRAEHLVRSRGARDQIEVETYHDRIRETLVSALSRETIAATHLRLAAALEAEGDADPEALFSHFVAAGDTARALSFVELAADRAEAALAFARAAALYKKALELRGDSPQHLREKRAHALANAGRGAEAGRAYLEAVPGTAPAEALDLRRRAAEQFLRSGYIDDGLAAVSEVLQTVGLRLPESPAGALASLVMRRAQLSLRGVTYKERRAAEVSPEELSRIDVCWSVGHGLAGIDVIRSTDFQARHLLYALRAGEPYRIARALALESTLTACEGAEERAALLAERAEAIAQRIENPHALAWAAAAAAGVAYYASRFHDAAALTARAVSLFRVTSRDVTWEIGTMQSWWLLPSLYYLGEIDEFTRQVPICLREAEDLGALSYELAVRTFNMTRVHLALDRPAEARRDVDEAMRRWSDRHGWHTLHACAMVGRTSAYLYEGDGLRAHAVMEESWPLLERSLLLRVEITRIDVVTFRASAALLAARQADDREGMLRAAERGARALEKETRPYAMGFALVLRAGIALRRGKPEQAVVLYDAAANVFSELSMKLHAAAARHRRGEILGGDEGRALVREASEWMQGQRIRDPGRMAAMIAPL